MELKFEESATSAGINCINSNQIKSATDNTGEFNPENDSILFSTQEDNAPLTDAQARMLIDELALIAEPFPEFEEMTEEAWAREFGEGGFITDPQGRTVKLGENQMYKQDLRDNKTRKKSWKMLKPTIERPSVILQELSNGRPSNARNYLKAFTGDKTRWYISISVNIDEVGDILISSHKINNSNLRKKIKENLVIYKITDNGQLATYGSDHQVTNGLNKNITSDSSSVNDTLIHINDDAKMSYGDYIRAINESDRWNTII